MNTQLILSIILTIATLVLHRSLLVNRQDFLTRREYASILFSGIVFATSNGIFGAFSRNLDIGICFVSALTVMTFFKFDRNLDSKWLRGRMNLIANVSIVSSAAILSAIPFTSSFTPLIMQGLIFTFVMRSLQHEMHRMRLDLEVLQNKLRKSESSLQKSANPPPHSIRDKYQKAS